MRKGRKLRRRKGAGEECFERKPGADYRNLGEACPGEPREFWSATSNRGTYQWLDQHPPRWRARQFRSLETCYLGRERRQLAGLCLLVGRGLLDPATGRGRGAGRRSARIEGARRRITLPTKSWVLVSLIGTERPSGVCLAEVAIWMTASMSSLEGGGGGLGDLGWAEGGRETRGCWIFLL